MKRTVLLLGMFFYALISAHAAYELVWSDEFDYNGINTSVWTFETGTGNWGWGNGESQYYRAENATIADGKLVITAKKENYNGSAYTSARMKTSGKVQFRYGRIEGYIKVPQPAAGVWPAFWMLGTARGGAWPYCGEFDIMEVMCTSDQSTWKRTLNTYHWNNKGINGGYENVNYGRNYQYSENLANDYHVYGMEWTPTQVRGYFKATPTSQEITVCTMGNADATGPENGRYAFVGYEAYMILNVALGGTYVNGNIDANYTEGKMYVDWIRVYQDRTTYTSSNFTDNSTPKGSSTGNASFTGDPVVPPADNTPEVECNNAFSAYKAIRTTVNKNNNWTDNNNSNYAGTTITCKPTDSFNDVYVVATGQARKLVTGKRYRLSGTITSTVGGTVGAYLESASNNGNQLFKANTVNLTAGVAAKFSVEGVPTADMKDPAFVLHITNSTPGSTYTITDVTIKETNCPDAVIETMAETPLSIYPNPASEVLYLNSPKEIKQVGVVNLNGAQIAVPTSDDGQQVEVAGLNAGIYFLRVEFVDGSRRVLKFIKK